MQRLALAFLVTAALASAACGGGGEGGNVKQSTPQAGSPIATGTAATTPEPEDEEAMAARAAAEKAFLKLDDFPTGWKQAPPTSVTPQELDLPSDCQSPLLSRKQPPDSVVQADSPEFAGSAGQQVGSRVIVFRDEGTAREYVGAVDNFVETFDRCRQALIEALKKSSSPGAPPTDVKLERLSLEPLGDQSFALRLTVFVQSKGVTLSFASDLLVARVGRMVGLVGYLSTTLSPPDLSEEGRLAGIVASRLTDAVKQLD